VNGQRGASLPETAITIAVVFALLFGIIDFGRALYTYGFVAQLAREGARWAIVRGSECTKLDHCPAQGGSTDIQPYIQSLSEGATSAGGLTASLQWPTCPNGASGSNAPGCTAEVTVGYPFAFIMPFLPQAQINMSSTSEMVISE